MICNICKSIIPKNNDGCCPDCLTPLTNKKRLKAICLVFTAILFQSCATTYKCGEFPEGKCQNVSDVYRKSLNDHSASDDNFSNLNSTKNISMSDDQLKDGHPILSRPRVLRVLFNKWMDKDGDLNLGGYMFLKIEDSKWQIQ